MGLASQWLLACHGWSVRRALMKTKGRVAKYVRFEHDGLVSYGLWENGTVKALAGDIFRGPTPTIGEYPASQTRFLVPCEPSKVLAVGLNYASHRVHVESSEGVILNAAGRPVPSTYPGVFPKFPTSLIPDREDIVFPGDATHVPLHGELVLVVGQKANDVPVELASSYV